MKSGLFVSCLLIVAGCPAEETSPEEGSGSASDSASGSESGEPPATCEDLEPPVTAEVELRITNNRADPIFVDGGCGPALLLSQVGASTRFNADTCDAPTCEASLAGDCSTACAACLPGVLRIEPGASYTQAWAGSIWESVDVANVCALCTDRCWQEHPAPEGDYQLTAHLWLECPPSLENCECPPGTQPPCFIEAYDGAVNAEERTVDFAMPTAGPVELVIE